MSLSLRPLTLRQANAFVSRHHSHHKPTRGCKYCIGCDRGGELVGVVIVERPKARMLDDGWTLELSRVCTDRTPHVASKLIAAATRAAFAMGARRVVSYVLEGEAGASYLAAGWREAADAVVGGDWSRPSRPRETSVRTLFGEEQKYPTVAKRRWEKTA